MITSKLSNLFQFVLISIILSCETEEPVSTYLLAVTASPIEGGTIIAYPSSGLYTEGQIVTLTPAPNPYWKFQGWSGDASDSVMQLSVTMNSNKNITAIFVKGAEFSIAENGITCKCQKANPGEKGLINGVEYEAVDNKLIRQRRDQAIDMTRLCTSLVTDMSELFLERDFNQAIGGWDVSKVTDMRGMFANSTFNQPIGSWDVSNVTDMVSMFWWTPFNQPISNWDVSKVTNMSGMFYNSSFNHPIGDWNVGNVAEMNVVFAESPFNQPIGNWDVSKVTNMQSLFHNTPFNQPISDWDVSSVINMLGMFRKSQFNQSIGEWDVNNVTDMREMFSQNTKFNQDLSKWCVEKILERPNGFRLGATAWTLPEPTWGTCPD